MKPLTYSIVFISVFIQEAYAHAVEGSFSILIAY